VHQSERRDDLKGVFELRSAEQLLKKLEADLDRVIGNSLDSYAAFDFFVTAWHLVEWKHPRNSDEAARSALLRRHPVLRVCEHLAVGAKHFEPDSQRHTSVTDSARVDSWASGAWPTGVWAPGTWAAELVVHLDGTAREQLGEKVTVQRLARLVMDAWRSEF
jgi:hypothetical protein